MNYDEKAAEVCKVVGRYCPESLGYDRDLAAIAAALREAAAEAYEDAAVRQRRDGWNDNDTMVNQKDQAYRWAGIFDKLAADLTNPAPQEGHGK